MAGMSAVDARAPGADVAHDADHRQYQSNHSCRRRHVALAVPAQSMSIRRGSGAILAAWRRGRDMLSAMKIALVQQHATRDKSRNLARGLAALDQAAAAGARVVCFAELAFEWFYPQRPAGGDRRSLTEPIDGPTSPPSRPRPASTAWSW